MNPTTVIIKSLGLASIELVGTTLFIMGTIALMATAIGVWGAWEGLVSIVMTVGGWIMRKAN